MPATPAFAALQGRDDHWHEMLIGAGESITAELPGEHPKNLRALKHLRLTLNNLDDEWVQPHANTGVIVAEDANGPDGTNLDRQLFTNLTADALFRRLAGFKLAPGKLPVAAETVLVLAAADQDAIFPTDDRDGNIEDPQHRLQESSDARPLSTNHRINHRIGLTNASWYPRLTPAMARTRIKICGISRPQDAAVAVAAGADAIGMVFAPAAFRNCSGDLARQIVDALAPFVTPVGVFVDAPVTGIRALARSLRLSTIQLHGQESPQTVAELSEFNVLKVIHADAATLDATLVRWREARLANLRGIVLETPGGSGGGGAENDWEAIRLAQERGSFDGLPPIILAGGLHPGNVAHVVRMLRPWAVDVSSGVEAGRGQKSATRIQEFIAAVRCAD